MEIWGDCCVYVTTGSALKEQGDAEEAAIHSPYEGVTMAE